MSPTGQVLIERLPAPWRDRKRKYEIFIDGQAVGLIGPGESRHFNLSAGQHAVRLKIDWMGSQQLSLEVAPGGVVGLEAEPSGSSWTAVLDVIFRRRPYIVLRHKSG